MNPLFTRSEGTQPSINSFLNTLEISNSFMISSEEGKQQARKKQRTKRQLVTERNITEIQSKIRSGQEFESNLVIRSSEVYDSIAGSMVEQGTEPLGEGAYGTVTLSADPMINGKAAVIKHSSPRKVRDRDTRIELVGTTRNEIEKINYIQQCLKDDSEVLNTIKAIFSIEETTSGRYTNRSYQIISDYCGFQADTYFPKVDVIIVLAGQSISEQTNSYKETLYSSRIRMEHCGSDVFSYVEKSEVKLTNLSVMCKQWINGLRYLHEKGVVHRDIKPENLFVNSNKSQKIIAKVGDFGAASFLPSDGLLYEMAGTLLTLPPESLIGIGYNEKADVWAIGISLLFIILREMPVLTADSLVLLHCLEKGLNIDLGQVLSRSPRFRKTNVSEFFIRDSLGTRLKPIDWEPVYESVFEDAGYYFENGSWHYEGGEPINDRQIVQEKMKAKAFANGYFQSSFKERLNAKIKNNDPLKESVIDLILKCLTINIEERPSMEEILQHPFLAQKLISPIKSRFQGSVNSSSSLFSTERLQAPIKRTTAGLVTDMQESYRDRGAMQISSASSTQNSIASIYPVISERRVITSVEKRLPTLTTHKPERGSLKHGAFRTLYLGNGK